MNLNSGTVAFVFGVVFLILSISFACLRLHRLSGNTFVFNFLVRSPPPPDSAAVPAAQRGLDDSTLNSFPKLSYSEMKQNKNHYSSNNIEDPSNSCSICLADYKDEDTLRLLPDCGHLYHLRCVDPWLKLHDSCPVCRTPTSSSSAKAHDDRSNNFLEGT
ncbi:putative RING-H2 finger protein ATL71 [Prosopis cineraria]|uniref:putative RING-H2 finger protein ATL71 n=1 Tax=Prosopis cineraria TaxID=364024 RepID=UPI00240F0325|nr:putative RING-H2 finger protein ATL71 [Prosopis cineraria]